MDSIIKLIGFTLLVTTIISFILILFKGPIESNLFPKITYNDSNILFIIALMGWMPTAVDLSSWNSLWTLERMKLSNYSPKLSETVFEFNLGYISSAILSICFITLGAYLMYGSDSEFSNNSALFANQVIQLYTASIGSWSYYIIAISSFSIMFGTCIAVFDGYARSASESIRLVQQKGIEDNKVYKIIIGLLVFGSTLIIYLFGSKLKQLVDLATTISFLIAPFVAIANYTLVTKNFDKKAQTKKMVTNLSNNWYCLFDRFLFNIHLLQSILDKKFYFKSIKLLTALPSSYPLFFLNILPDLSVSQLRILASQNTKKNRNISL